MRIGFPREVSGNELADAIIRAGSVLHYFFPYYVTVTPDSQKSYEPVREQQFIEHEDNAFKRITIWNKRIGLFRSTDEFCFDFLVNPDQSYTNIESDVSIRSYQRHKRALDGLVSQLYFRLNCPHYQG